MKSTIQFSQQSFLTFLRGIPQIVFIMNAEGETLYYNERWLEYTGDTLASLKSKDWMKWIHPEDLAPIRHHWEQARTTGKGWSLEYRLRRQDEVYRWHLGRWTPDLDEKGQVRHWLMNATDIDDQKNAEKNLLDINEQLEQKVNQRTKELQQANTFLDTIIENIPNMIFVKDAETLKFVRFNRAGEELIGVVREQLIGKGDYDFFPETEAAAFQEKDRAVIAGKAVVDIPEEPLSTVKNGLRILHTKKIPVFDTNGKPSYLVGISEDITEVKKIEQERLQFLKEQIAKNEAERTAERFKFLSEASALLGSTLDYEEILKKLTQLSVPKIADWCSIHLVQADQSMRPLAVAHSGPVPPASVEDLICSQELIETGKSVLMSQVPEHLQYVGFSSYICTPIRSRGKALGLLTLATTPASGRIYSQADLHLLEDIADRAGTAVQNSQLYKEAHHLNRIKDEFLATLSHELRTPLNVILGHAEILNSERESIDTEQMKISLEAIYRNAKTQTGLIEDLLDVSSIITGKVSYKPTQVSPAEIVQNIVTSLKATAEAKQIQLKGQLSHGPKIVYADATRLHQIIWNLISNAIKFTPQGGRVEVSVEFKSSDWEVVVKDNGRGIDPHFLPYVFDRFRQEDSSVTRSYGGLGLGLAIVRHLVELHGGSVHAESEGKDKGATFRVTFPLKGAVVREVIGREPRISRRSSKNLDSVSLQDIKILVVEDSPDSRFLIQLLLTRAGAEVCVAESAQGARQQLEKFVPDIIISDVGMAEESGIEFMKKIRQSDLKYKDIPAIALTAYVRTEEKDAILKAGFQTHIGKPVNKDSLLSEITRILGQ